MDLAVCNKRVSFINFFSLAYVTILVTLWS